MAEPAAQVVRAFIELFRQGQADEALRLLHEQAVLDITRLDPVLAVIAESGRGKGSGARVERRYASLYNVIDGQVVRMTHFPTERDALQAAGAPS